MALPNNTKVFDECGKTPEPIYDPSYQKDRLIITENPRQPNALMRANLDILGAITTYKTLLDLHKSDPVVTEGLLSRVRRRLGTPDINYSEFTSFWETLDVSYSLYRKLSSSEQRDFLRKAIAQYAERRHDLYLTHGYTSTTLQVKADSFAHKSTGEQGLRKIERLLKQFHIRQLSAGGPRLRERQFALVDKLGQGFFAREIRHRRMRFAWGKEHQGKLPDAVLQARGHFFVVEHKHIKEYGGGQDKQIVELIEFIRQREIGPPVHYVAFLDGIMFNKIYSGLGGRKVVEQRRQIRRALKNQPSNFFVNTHGFGLLIGAALRSQTRRKNQARS